MKTNFTRLLLFAALFFTVLQASAQSVGDFRTNFVTASGAWTPSATVSNWERFDGTTWVAMPVASYPTSADGVITIQAGDSVTLSGGASSMSIDQVVIEPGAVLAIFSNIAGAVTVANGAGDDITVNGRLYVAGGANTTGPGNIHVNAGGLFTLRNTGVLGVSVTNDGQMNLGAAGVSAGTILSTTVTNNVGATCIWIDGIANLSTGASFVNNGNFYATQLSTATVNWNNTGSGNSIINTGSMLNMTTNTMNIVPSVTNTGTIGGTGTYLFTTFPTNTGIISPGLSPGTLSVSAVAITGKAPAINIELATDGAVQGTNYDHLIVPTAVNITGATLNVTNTTTIADPVNTTYTILTTTAGNITGPFAAVNGLTSNYTVTYNANSVVLTKIALFPLPVTWGEFKALAQGSKVLLDWTTLMEENTSHFVVEHSTSGSTFTPIANVEARGNSTYEANYKYTFASPDLTKANYFRIKQVDLDGKSTYSVTRSVKFDKGQVVAIQAYPNPVKDVLTLNIQRENIQVLLADQTGKTIQRLNVQPGQHSINMQSLPSGIYQLAVFEKGVRIETKQIMKQ